MKYRSSEVKAGIFIFSAFITLMALLFFLGDIKTHLRSWRTVEILFNFAEGLEVAAPVHYAGLQMGRVKALRIFSTENGEEDRVSVVVEINPSVRLKKDSLATIKTSGLMGGLYISIRPGSKDSPLLEEGEPLIGMDAFEFTEVGDIMENFVLQARRGVNIAEKSAVEVSRSLQSINALTENINAMITENRGHISSSLKHLSAVSREAEQLIVSNGDQLATILARADAVTKEMEALLARIGPPVVSAADNMEKGSALAVSEIASLSREARGTLNQGSDILLENRRHILELTRNLRDTAENLKALSGDLKRNPWKLIKETDEKPDSEEAAIDRDRHLKELRMKRHDRVQVP